MKKSRKLGPQSLIDFQRENQIYEQDLQQEPVPNRQIKDQHFFSGVQNNLWNNPHQLVQSRGFFQEQMKRNEKFEKDLNQKANEENEEIQQYKRNQIQHVKYEDECLQNKRILEVAMSQKESGQPLDSKQNEAIQKYNIPNAESLNQSPQEIIQKSIPQVYLHPNIKNSWNQLDNIDLKKSQIIWNTFVVKQEEKAIDRISAQIKEQIALQELQKRTQLQKKAMIRENFIKLHQKNVELEKNLQLGVFGQNVQSGNETIRQTIEVQSARSDFPLQFQTQILSPKAASASYSSGFHSQQSISPRINSAKQVFERLTAQREKFLPEETAMYPDFRGLLIADVDQQMIYKLNNIIEPIQTTPRIQNLFEGVRKTSLQSLNQDPIVWRPKTAMTTFQSGQKSSRYSNYEKAEQQELNEEYYHISKELDNFDQTQSNHQQKTNNQELPSGFCRVSKSEYEILVDVKGYQHLQEMQQNPSYPHMKIEKENQTIKQQIVQKQN